MDKTIKINYRPYAHLNIIDFLNSCNIVLFPAELLQK